MQSSLSQILKGKVVLVGLGNVLKGDDGFGPALIERLQGQVAAVCLDAGLAPEKFTGTIIREKPDTILFIDAAHLGQFAGSWAILKNDEIVKSGLTTHDLSPSMLLDYLGHETSAGIYMLGVQPQQVQMGAELSAPVRKTLEELTQILKEALHA
jgi:hydrogenase 3 maturation protease